MTDGAKKYRDELEGKTLLFICMDKQSPISVFEFAFFKRNYLHLTGLKIRKNGNMGPEERTSAAVDFYEKCLAHKLSPSDFEFAEDGTTPLKLDVLPSVLNKNLSAKMIGNADMLRPRLQTERLAGNVTACIGFVRDSAGGLYVPNTVLKDDLRNNVVEGLQGDEYFNALVDFRNVAEGDKNLFVIEDSNLFIVAEAADGTQGIRRQRLSGVSETSIPTSLKVVKIYEELNRVLAGRVDFNTFINKVSESFRKKLLNDVYSLWSTATANDFGGTTYFPAAGTYDEDELLELIAHVEAAANGKPATILGTKKAVRNLAPSIQGTDSKSDLYNMGYYGKFYGSPVVVTPQRHKVGSTDFVLRDDVLTIIAGDDKPIKCVYEGDPIVIMGDPLTNGDLTQEYLYGEKYGMGIVLAGGNAGIGRYELA